MTAPGFFIPEGLAKSGSVCDNEEAGPAARRKEEIMFRPLTRVRQQLPEEECIQILKTQMRGVLSVQGDDGYPYGMPMNHFYREEDGRLYFHSAMEGHKVDAMRRSDKASFCVYDEGFRREGEWALNIRSVIVFGRIRVVEDRETVYRIAAELSRKFTDDEAYIRHELERSGPKTLMFALEPEYMTGKIVNEA